MLKRLTIARSLRRRWLYPVISITLSLSIVLSSTVATLAIPLPELIFRGIQVIQLSNLSARQEIAIGEQINQELLSKQVKLFRNQEAQSYINQIGQRLVQASDRPNIPYTFRVVDDSNLNAFATMGGFVYINTGTIAASDNVAQLASVIGHEMGHISGRHSLEQMKQMAIAQGIATIAGVGDDRLVGIGVNLALRLPNSREAEFDADRRGLLNITRSGFAARAMPAFMQKLASSGGGGGPSFLSSHPATGERIAALNQSIQANNLNTIGGLNDNEYQRIWRSRFR